jgi:hypothetical protein
MIKFVDQMGSTSTGVISYGLSKCKVVIPTCGHPRRLIGHDGGEFGNALEDDPKVGYLAFNEWENRLVMAVTGGCKRRCRTGVVRLTRMQLSASKWVLTSSARY